jgi:hypothetical protein
MRLERIKHRIYGGFQQDEMKRCPPAGSGKLHFRRIEQAISPFMDKYWPDSLNRLREYIH